MCARRPRDCLPKGSVGVRPLSRSANRPPMSLPEGFSFVFFPKHAAMEDSCGLVAPRRSRFKFEMN